MIQLVTQVRAGQSASIYQVMNKKDRHSNPINCKGIAGAFQLGEGLCYAVLKKLVRFECCIMFEHIIDSPFEFLSDKR